MRILATIDPANFLNADTCSYGKHSQPVIYLLWIMEQLRFQGIKFQDSCFIPQIEDDIFKHLKGKIKVWREGHHAIVHLIQEFPDASPTNSLS